ncbi:MAG TPA: Sir2 family NAD-dependent protein deacetylase, partial [Cyclobacteriaceae bacterium]
LRPNIVWFGEAVPMMEEAARLASQADLFVVVGTSMQVYPAAGLIDYVKRDVPKYLVDPKIPDLSHIPNLQSISDKASTGMVKLKEILLVKS